MADNSSRLVLEIDGRGYEGWTEVRVTTGLERIPSDFDIALTERWPGQQVDWRIKPGDECRVLIGGDLVVTGHVDAFAPQYDARSHSIRVTGRSKCADIVDCSADIKSGMFANATLLQVAQTLCKPFGIAVKAEVDTGGRLPDVQLQQGETIYALIERLSRVRQVLVCDDENGDLVLTRAGNQRAQGKLRQGVNILRASAELNHAQRHSRYVLKGQQQGSDQLFGAAAAEVIATVEDKAVKRYRPLVVVAEQSLDNKMAKDRIEWEARRRGGRSTRADISVRGWRQSDDGRTGSLWRRNLLVPVESDMLGLDRELVAGEVTYTLGKQGTICAQSLMPAEAFAPEPPDLDDLGLGKGGNWRDIVPVGATSRTAGSDGL